MERLAVHLLEVLLEDGEERVLGERDKVAVVVALGRNAEAGGDAGEPGKDEEAPDGCEGRGESGGVFSS